MTVGKGKRPRDPNQLAKWIVDRSTAEPTEEIIIPQNPAPPVDLSSYMAAIGRKGGQIGLLLPGAFVMDYLRNRFSDRGWSATAVRSRGSHRCGSGRLRGREAETTGGTVGRE